MGRARTGDLSAARGKMRLTAAYFPRPVYWAEFQRRAATGQSRQPARAQAEIFRGRVGVARLESTAELAWQGPQLRVLAAQ